MHAELDASRLGKIMNDTNAGLDAGGLGWAINNIKAELDTCRLNWVNNDTDAELEAGGFGRADKIAKKEIKVYECNLF